MMPEGAREQCKKILGNFTHRYHPHHSIRQSEGMPLGAFVADDYATRVNASRPRTAAQRTINVVFLDVDRRNAFLRSLLLQFPGQRQALGRFSDGFL